MTEHLLTVPEVAKALRLSTTFVWRRVLSGLWPSHKIGRSRRVAESDVRRLLEATRLEGKDLAVPGRTGGAEC